MSDADTAMPEELASWVAREAATAAGPVLLLGEAGPMPDGACPGPGTVRWLPRISGPQDLPLEQERFALAAVAGVFEHLQRDDAAALLAALRDRCARRVLVALARDAWSEQQMRAFAFEPQGSVRAGDSLRAAYAFDIDRYKHTPDWLDARNWANPELWGRFRW